MKISAFVTWSFEDGTISSLPAVDVLIHGCRMFSTDFKSVQFLEWLYRSLGLSKTDSLQIYVPRVGNGMTFNVYDVNEDTPKTNGLDKDNVWSKIRIYVKTYCHRDAGDVPEILRLLHDWMSSAQCSAFHFNLP